MGITTKGNGRVVFGSRIPPFMNTYSLEFDGMDDYVPLLPLASAVGFNNVSYSYWLKTSIPGVYQQYQVPFGGYSNGGAGFSIGLLSTPYLSTDLIGGNTILNDGVRHNVINTFDRTTKARLTYVDGVLTQTYTYPSYITHFAIGIGSMNGPAQYYFGGLVDECSHFQRILTPSEVTTIYNGGTPNDLTSLSPYGWWRNGDNDTYPNITDLGSGGNNGIMTNMVANNIVINTP